MSPDVAYIAVLTPSMTFLFSEKEEAALKSTGKSDCYADTATHFAQARLILCLSYLSLVKI